LPIANTSTELLAEYIARQIKRKVRQNFSAAIRYMEVAVEEAAGKEEFFATSSSRLERRSRVEKGIHQLKRQTR